MRPGSKQEREGIKDGSQEEILEPSFQCAEETKDTDEQTQKEGFQKTQQFWEVKEKGRSQEEKMKKKRT